MATYTTMCPFCGKAVDVEEEWEGSSVTCPWCDCDFELQRITKWHWVLGIGMIVFLGLAIGFALINGKNPWALFIPGQW
ncbi:MAG: hypothetical protein IJS01_03505 [Lentisphaeria bacterium]|nr:hypothetical protein [Lentisphaeria bacterium]